MNALPPEFPVIDQRAEPGGDVYSPPFPPPPLAPDTKPAKPVLAWPCDCGETRVWSGHDAGFKTCAECDCAIAKSPAERAADRAALRALVIRNLW
jgi:hypothetical protein